MFNHSTTNLVLSNFITVSKHNWELCSPALTGRSLFFISLDTCRTEGANMNHSIGCFVDQLKRHVSSCSADLQNDRWWATSLSSMPRFAKYHSSAIKRILFSYWQGNQNVSLSGGCMFSSCWNIWFLSVLGRRATLPSPHPHPTGKYFHSLCFLKGRDFLFT